MLQELLNLIASGDVQRPTDLAARLGVSVGLVEQMLSHLEGLGYLERVVTACQPDTAKCAHCGGGCIASGSRGWQLSRRAAR